MILLLLIAIIIATVLGITTLIKALTSNSRNTETQDPESTNLPSGTADTDNSSLQPAKPAEDRTVLIVFNNDSVRISNPGDDVNYSYNTGSHTLVIDIKNRTTDSYGNFPIEESKYFTDFLISEESESTRLVFKSDIEFNIEETFDGNILELSFISLKNSQILQYRNDLDRHYMVIDSAVLSAKSDSELKNYEENYDSINLVKKIIIPKHYMPSLQDEKVILNDGYLKSYEISNTDTSVELIFFLEEELSLYPNTRDYNSTLTFIKYRPDENLIVLDPGHGGIDGGAVSAGEEILEKDIVLIISSYLAENLREKGYNVYNLREEDVFLGLKERTDIANLLGADSIISIHINSFTDTSVNGTLTMYKTSLDLAKSIQNNLVAEIGSTNMGIVEMLDRAILNGAEMESVIVEMGFLTNPLEADKLKSDDYQVKVANGIAKGIAEFYESREMSDGN